MEHTNIYEPRLIIIKESTPVGQIYFHHTIYKIKSICFLNMGATNQEIDLCPCTKHGSSTILANRGGGKKMGARLFENSVFLNKTVGAVKNVSNTIKTTTQQAATQVIVFIIIFRAGRLRLLISLIHLKLIPKYHILLVVGLFLSE